MKKGTETKEVISIELLNYIFISLLMFLLICPSMIQAQNKNNDFIRYSQEMEQGLSESLSVKDYRKTIRLLNDWFEKYYRQDAATKANFQEGSIEMLMATCYFYLAEETAKDLKTDSTLIYLEKAISYGFIDYKSIKANADFEFLNQEQRFITLTESIKEKGDYLFVLKNSGHYTGSEAEVPMFEYKVSDIDLVKVKEYFNLDSIAGTGDEMSKILNLLNWAHGLIRHDGTKSCYETNAVDIYRFATENKCGVNCRALAVFLNECYLALGIKSRFITCNPKNYDDLDVHVINHVFSGQLGKWVWIDPTYNLYVTDDKGSLLSIFEVREKIINDEEIRINENANWNNEKSITKEEYIDNYMVKNLYWFQSALVFSYNTESSDNFKKNRHIALYPTGFNREVNQNTEVIVYDDIYFWER